MNWRKLPVWFAVIPLLWFATGVAASQLRVDAFWMDEEYTIFMAAGDRYTAPWYEMLRRVAQYSWPPFYYLAIHPWTTVFGWGEFSLRSFSMFFGIIAIASLYRFGRLINWRIGWISAALLTTSTFYIYYLHEARAYSLYLLLMIVSALLYWKFLNIRQIQRGQGIVFALVNAAFMATHYIAAAGMTAIGLYHLLFVPKKRRWHQVMRTFLLTLLLFSPWLGVTIAVVLSERVVERGLPNELVISEMLYAFSNGLAPWLIGLLIYSALVLRGRTIGYLWIMLIGTTITALIFNLFTDFLFHIRHIMIIQPLLYLICAAGIDHLLRQRYRVIGVGLLGVWMIVGVIQMTSTDFIYALAGQQQTIPYDTMSDITTVYRECVGERDAVVFNIVDRPEVNELFIVNILNYYIRDQRDPMIQYTQLLRVYDFQTEVVIEGDTLAEKWLTFIGEAQSVWFIQREDYHTHPAAQEFDQLMRVQYPACHQLRTETEVILRLYGSPPPMNCTAIPQTWTTCDPIPE
ncbi:MAG: glycosyltransferase family 39 protein [Anaerolineae bacterium]|jgi:uncharacterized membrane protein|nr:glycosyltransferase family 39 protein [Anaerolineae bacterium]